MNKFSFISSKCTNNLNEDNSSNFEENLEENFDEENEHFVKYPEFKLKGNVNYNINNWNDSFLD